jgi:hypothetical protein
VMTVVVARQSKSTSRRSKSVWIRDNCAENDCETGMRMLMLSPVLVPPPGLVLVIVKLQEWLPHEIIMVAMQ